MYVYTVEFSMFSLFMCLLEFSIFSLSVFDCKWYTGAARHTRPDCSGCQSCPPHPWGLAPGDPLTTLGRLAPHHTEVPTGIQQESLSTCQKKIHCCYLFNIKTCLI